MDETYEKLAEIDRAIGKLVAQRSETTFDFEWECREFWRRIYLDLIHTKCHEDAVIYADEGVAGHIRMFGEGIEVVRGNE